MNTVAVSSDAETVEEKSLFLTEERILTLVSKEGVQYDIPYEYAKVSKVISTATENINENRVDLLSVSDRNLKHIVDLMKHYKGNPPEVLKKSRIDFKERVDAYSYSLVTSLVSLTDEKSEDSKKYYNSERLLEFCKEVNWLDFPYLFSLVCSYYAFHCQRLGMKSLAQQIIPSSKSLLLPKEF